MCISESDSLTDEWRVAHTGMQVAIHKVRNVTLSAR